MQKIIPFSPLLIDALRFNLIFKNAYKPPGPKYFFSHEIQIIPLPIKYLVKESLKRGKGLTNFVFYNNASLLPVMITLFCSL